MQERVRILASYILMVSLIRPNRRSGQMPPLPLALQDGKVSRTCGSHLDLKDAHRDYMGFA